ncbi:RNA-directed DNA polymerase from mobile element jockey [Trichonephila clavipes]|nr:RNA-directed DNA polymerase from mobile element jockey [Trichonephila clavipes]
MNDIRGDTKRAKIGSNTGNPCCLGGYTNPFERDNVGTWSESNAAAMFTQCSGLEMAKEYLQAYLSQLRRWLKFWRIKINANKSHVIVFRKGNYTNNMAPLKLFGSNIPWSTSVDYLGIPLDRKLTYKHHLTKIKCTFKQRLAFLRDLLCNRSTFSLQNKIRIFLQCLQPLITLILNVPRYFSSRYLHADLDVSPIHTRIRELAPSFSQNVSSHRNNSIAQAANFPAGLHRNAAYGVK